MIYVGIFTEIFSILFAIEHLPGPGGDRDDLTVAEGEPATELEAEGRGRCDYLHAADSGDCAHQGPRHYAHPGDYLSERRRRLFTKDIIQFGTDL